MRLLRISGRADTTIDKRNQLELCKYVSLTQFSASILDTYIPRCRRLTQLHFGKIVSNRDAQQAFSDNPGYNMTFNLVEPHKGNALHTHPSVEIFIAMDGRWEIAWGETGEQSVVLEPLDLIACPADVRHSYKNITPHRAQNIMTILIGAPAITWAPAVVAEARAHGAKCTRRGVLLDFWSSGSSGSPQAVPADSDDDDDEAAAAAEAAYHRPASEAEMQQYVRRFDPRSSASSTASSFASASVKRRPPLVITTPESYLTMTWVVLHQGEALRACDAPTEADLLVVIGEGDVEIGEGNGFAGWSGKPIGVANRLDAVRIPRGDAARGARLTNRYHERCALLVVQSEARPLVEKKCDAWTISDTPLTRKQLNGIRAHAAGAQAAPVPPSRSADSVIPARGGVRA